MDLNRNNDDSAVTVQLVERASSRFTRRLRNNFSKTFHSMHLAH